VAQDVGAARMREGRRRVARRVKRILEVSGCVRYRGCRCCRY
jgi:hypothetical protein